MKCASCQDEIHLVSAVEQSTRSWPHLQTVLHVCPKCAARIYLRFEADTAYLVCPATALSPRWTYLASEKCKGLVLRQEREGLRIRIGQLSRLVPAR